MTSERLHTIIGYIFLGISLTGIAYVVACDFAIETYRDGRSICRSIYGEPK